MDNQEQPQEEKKLLNESGKNDSNTANNNKKAADKKPKPPPSQKGKVLAQVLMLDGSNNEVLIDKKAEGQELLDKVCESISVLEKDYFCLSYYDKEDYKFWLENDKKISKQVGNKWVFAFEVKFYPIDPQSLQEDITRYQLCLQVRNDVKANRVPCSFVTYALLGSYSVQSELGDHDVDEHGRTSEYIEGFHQDYNFCPAAHASQELFEKIAELHKTHRGQAPEEADSLYLDNAKKLAMYGIDLHPARDSNNDDIQIGVCASGLLVYKDGLRISRFTWPKIIKFNWKRNNFYIKVRKDEDDKLPPTYGFKLASHKLAKRLYKTAVEHHGFFRLKEPEPVQKKPFPQMGNRFRYSGRTLAQTRQNQIDRDDPQFRGTSGRYRGGRDGAPHYPTATIDRSQDVIMMNPKTVATLDRPGTRQRGGRVSTADPENDDIDPTYYGRGSQDRVDVMPNAGRAQYTKPSRGMGGPAQPGERPGNVPGYQPYVCPDDTRVIRYGPNPDDEIRYNYDDNNQPRDANGKMLPKDNNGHICFPQVSNVKVIPGGAIQDDCAYIVGDDGRPYAMDGTPLPTDAHGVPILPWQVPRPGEKAGNVPGHQPFISPDGTRSIRFGPNPEDEVRYNYDDNGRPIDEMGRPLPVDSDGHFGFPDHPNVKVIPAGHPGNSTGDDCAYLIGNDDRPYAADGTPLPTWCGVPFLPSCVAEQPGERCANVPGYQPYVRPDGTRVVRYGPNPDEELAYSYDENNRPVDKDGKLLPTDSNGHIVFPNVANVKVIPGGAVQDDCAYMVANNGRPYALDGTPLPTDENGVPVLPVTAAPGDAPGAIRVIRFGPNPDEQVKYTYNAQGRACDLDGMPLPVDEKGHITFPTVQNVRVIPGGAEQDDIAYMVDNEGRPRAMDGNLLPTDRLGNIIIPPPGARFINMGPGQDDIVYTIGPDGKPRDLDGKILPTDEQGRVLIYPRGIQCIRTGPGQDDIMYTYGDDGKARDMDGNLLPVDPSGHIVFTKQAVRVIPGRQGKDDIAYMVGEDGLPRAMDGNLLPTDKDGNIIIPPKGARFINMGPGQDDIVYTVGDDGKPRDLSGKILPTDEQGRVIVYPKGIQRIKLGPGQDDFLYQIGDDGLPRDLDGKLLPTDEKGNIIITKNVTIEVEAPEGSLPPETETKRVTQIISSGNDEDDWDALLTQAIADVTDMNPDLSVQKIEIHTKTETETDI